MKNFCLIIIFIGMCISCTNEDTKIKKALINSIPKSLYGEYKYHSHLLLETILKSNLTDSLLSLKIAIGTTRDLMRSDSLRLYNIRYNIADSKRQRANTLYSMRSIYDDIIEDYEEMEAEIVTNLESKNNQIAEKESRIAFWSQAMANTNSPIMFYKVKHSYKLRGMYRDTVVLLTSKFEIAK